MMGRLALVGLAIVFLAVVPRARPEISHVMLAWPGTVHWVTSLSFCHLHWAGVSTYLPVSPEREFCCGPGPLVRLATER